MKVENRIQQTQIWTSFVTSLTETHPHIGHEKTLLMQANKLDRGSWWNTSYTCSKRHCRPRTLPNIPKNPARLRVRVEPLDIVLRSDSTRIADRDLGRPVDAGGESRAVPATPEWLPLTLDESCSSNGMSVGIRKPDLYFSTVSRESCIANHPTNIWSETGQWHRYQSKTW